MPDSGIIGGREGQVRGGSYVRGDSLTPGVLASLTILAIVDGSQRRCEVDPYQSRCDVDSGQIRIEVEP